MTIMDCNEIGRKIELNNSTVRTFLCRQEFNKYATYQRVNSTRSSICFNISKDFLIDLQELMDTKMLYKQYKLVEKWKNEYI